MFIKWNAKTKKYRVSHKGITKHFTQKDFDALHSYVNLRERMEA